MPYLGASGDIPGANIKTYRYKQGADTSTGATSFPAVNKGADELRVYLNGALLKLTADYTFTTSAVSITPAPADDDEIQIDVYTSMNLADTVSSSDGGNFVSAVTFQSGVKTGAVKAQDGTSAINIADSTGKVTIPGDLEIQGTTTTIDTNVESVDKLEVGANSTDYAVKVNQTGTGNLLQLQDNGTDVMVVKDDGNVGIGTDSPTSDGGTTLEIYNASTPTLRLNDGGDYKALVQLRGNDTEIRGSSGNMEFYTGNADGESSTERMKIASAGDVTVSTGNLVIGTHGKGIDFSANTDDEIGAGSIDGGEILDDYEVGTWVPQLTEGSYNYTMNSDNGGRYVKIGNMVHISAMVRPNDNVHSNGDYTAQALITGLPFTSATGSRNSAGLSIGYFDFDDVTVVGTYAYISNNTSQIELYRTTSSSTGLDALKVGSGGFNGSGTQTHYLYLSGTYYTD